MSDMTLYYFPLSSCSRKVLFSLNEKKLDYKKVIIDLPTGAQKHLEYLKINPHGKVPALQCGNEIIYDSAVIMEFLEDMFPQSPLLPIDPLKKAVVRKYTQYADQFFYPAISNILAHLRKPPSSINTTLTNELITMFENEHLSFLHKLLANRQSTFLFDSLSLADIAFAVGLIRLKEVIPQKILLAPATDQWVNTIENLPSFKMISTEKEYEHVGN